MLKVKGKNNEDGSFDWRDALIDAGIIAALAFFTALLTGFADGALTQTEVLIAAITAGAEFFGLLAMKRGLRPKEG